MAACCTVLAMTALIGSAPPGGRALALGWPGWADTRHRLDSIGTGDFTVTAWFMAQYPHAHPGPIVDAGGIAVSVGGGRDGLPALTVDADGRRHWMPLEMIDRTPDALPPGTAVVDDFDDGSWDGWRVEGDAFDGAARAGFLGQTTPCGWRGPGLVNTSAPDDRATGRATLGPFLLERPFVYLLVGGGNHPGRCGVSLLVEGAGEEPVASSTGRGSEWLTLERWDVGRFRGRRAAIRIIDEVRGGWGHVLVDRIVASDQPRARAIYPGDLRLTWQHLAVVRRDGKVSLYLNGEPVGAPVEGAGAIGGTLRLGRRAEAAGRAEQFYGLIDDVAIFERALDRAGLAVLSGSVTLDGATVADARPAGLWTFDDRQVLDLAERGAEIVTVSAERDDFADRRRLPPPRAGPELVLPVAPGSTWWVTQGYDHRGGTHVGVASFCLDMVRVDGDTAGAPVRAAAAGTVEHVYDRTPGGAPGPANIVVVRHAGGTCTSYVHLAHGSAPDRPGAVEAGDVIGRAGDTGAAPGAHHLHVAATDQPEDGRHPFVTIPVAFSDYRVSEDLGRTWRHVERGVPETGQWVRTGRAR